MRGANKAVGRGCFDAGQGGMLVLRQYLLFSASAFWIACSLSRVSHLKEEDDGFFLANSSTTGVHGLPYRGAFRMGKEPFSCVQKEHDERDVVIIHLNERPEEQ